MELFYALNDVTLATKLSLEERGRDREREREREKGEGKRGPILCDILLPKLLIVTIVALYMKLM